MSMKRVGMARTVSAALVIGFCVYLLLSNSASAVTLLESVQGGLF